MDDPVLQSAADLAKEAHAKAEELRMESIGLKLGEITSLNATAMLDETGTLKHRYFKSTWYTVYRPYMQCPFYIKSYDAAKKVFTIQVLWDGRELAIPVGSTAIPITEEEAEQLKQQRLAFSTNTKPKTTTETMSETATAPPLSDRKAEKPPKEKKSRQRDDGKLPIRQIVLQGLAAGKDRKAIVEDILAVYPDKDKTKAGQLASLYKYNEKNKDKPKKPKPPKAGSESPDPAPANGDTPTPPEG